MGRGSSWGALWLAGLIAACGSQDNLFSTTTSGQGGQGATGGGGSTGGTGGATSGTAGTGGAGGSPCGTDCSQIVAPECHVSVCNEQLGQCEVVDAADSTACEDGLYCTTGDTCTQGECVGGPQNDCGIVPGMCVEVGCDEGADACFTTAQSDGTPCTDPNDLCLLGPTCQSGFCIGATKNCSGQPVPDECHVSACNPQNGNCEPVPGNNGQACNDPNDLCTVNKTCAAGVCQGGQPKDCSYLTQGCTVGVCNTQNGQCVVANAPNGFPCDDTDACTTGESCQSGTCGSGAPVTSCEQNGDGCCPSNCNPNNDVDCAFAELDIGPHATIYSWPDHTRGYWFVAPTNFTIKGLRVPVDVGTDPQNIQVVRFNNGPPLPSPSTTDFVTLGYWSGVPGTGWISTNILVQSGDIIGILGARGTTTMNTSYGTGPTYGTTIFGQATMLTRLMYQSNLSWGQAGPLLTANNAPYARIEMQYGP